MSKIWVLGAGQLGAMLKHAATPLALDVEPVDIEDHHSLHLSQGDIITAEREQWPETDATSQLAAHSGFVNKDVFATLADRFTQKSLIDQLGLATAPWFNVTEQTQEAQLHSDLGERVLLKRRTGGYDGKGQHWLKQAENIAIPDDFKNASIAEQGINFDEEVSLVGVRTAEGQSFFYPLTLNLHVNGILMASVANLDRLKSLQAKAETMLKKLMDSLDYVGVMAMETFRVCGEEGDELLINELAPRVHNSGHWTQAGSNISQFEAHVRAVAKLPLTQPSVQGESVMINLIGTELNHQWLAVSGAQLYWYDKVVRAGRKVGHINFCRDTASQLIDSMNQLAPELPYNYHKVIAWVKTALEA